jgi:hypothetical protein
LVLNNFPQTVQCFVLSLVGGLDTAGGSH